MRINIFEGARRIALLVGGMWVVGLIAYAVLAKPYASIEFTTLLPDGNFLPLTVSCGSDDAREFTTTRTERGHEVHVMLCFRASKSDDGRRLVPFRLATPQETPPNAGRYYRMNERYSAEVREYTERRAKEFVLPMDNADKAETAYDTARLNIWKDALGALFGGIAILWLFTTVIGWVVRGFAGIPRGRDSAPKLAADAPPTNPS